MRPAGIPRGGYFESNQPILPEINTPSTVKPTFSKKVNNLMMNDV